MKRKNVQYRRKGSSVGAFGNKKTAFRKGRRLRQGFNAIKKNTGLESGVDG
jgi:hypothetical protein